MSRLGRDFFARPAWVVARDLLGCEIQHGPVSVRLTEVEAYDGEGDPGSHAYRGITPRTEPMFGPAGHLYVYFSYGMHVCANVVTGETGAASAVLLRAGDVIAGHDLALRRRLASGRRRSPIPDHHLARGPANLASALGITLAHSGADATGGHDPVYFSAGVEVPPGGIRSGPRVGVSGPGGDAEAFPWRFWIAGEPTVSAYRPGVARARGRLGP